MSIGKSLRFARHVGPGSIVRRARLLAKRRTFVRFPVLARALELRPAGPVSAEPGAASGPLFQPDRTTRQDAPDAATIDLLNTPYRLAIPIDWQDPVLDHGTGLAKMTLHTMQFVEDVDDTLFERVVRDWIAANPAYRGRYWHLIWNSFTISIRAVAWMQQLAERHERLSEDFLETAHRSLFEQISFLFHNIEEDIRGNHIIQNIKALFWGAHYFRGPDARKWYRKAARLLRRELPHQILSDGFHFERSPAYHGQVFADLLQAFRVAEQPERDFLRPYLDAMAQAIADTTHGDGLCALFNDGGLHMAHAPAEMLALWSRLGGAPEPQPRSHFSFGEAGYYGTRLGRAQLIVDCGPMSADELMAHAHGDILAFELSIGAQRICVDPGVFEYGAGTLRDYCRATTSHNTVAIDGQDQAEFFGAFRVGRRGRGTVLALTNAPGAPFALRGTHDGYRHLPGRPAHERSFVFDGSELTIRDAVHGGTGQSATARLLLHPDCTATSIDPHRLRIDTPAGALDILSSRAPLVLGAADYMPDFGVRVPTICIDIGLGAVPCDNALIIKLL